MPERIATLRSPAKPKSVPSLRPAAASPIAPVVRSGTHSGGQALDNHTNAAMSARFGHDFSQVRVHTDSRAEESAAALGANAYTVGSDIVFGGGSYAPGSPDTERLLAHELTHVVQQAQLGGGDWGRQSTRGDASEREAHSLAGQVMMGQTVQVQAAPQAAVARDEMPDVPDTPSVREKDKPGGPTDAGDKGFSLSWDQIWPPKNLLSPKSASLDPGQGDPLSLSRPGAPAGPNLTPPVMLPPATTADPNKGMCTPNDPAPAPLPMAPAWQPSAPAPSGGGLLGQPYDPAQPYGPPSTWQPSATTIGPF